MKFNEAKRCSHLYLRGCVGPCAVSLHRPHPADLVVVASNTNTGHKEKVVHAHTQGQGQGQGTLHFDYNVRGMKGTIV